MSFDKGQYAPAPGDGLDVVGEDGLTVEGWFYIDRLPTAGERWVLFAKPGSYAVELWGPDPWWVRWNPWKGGLGDPSVAVNSGRGAMRDCPVARWFYIAVEYHDHLLREDIFDPRLLDRMLSFGTPSKYVAVSASAVDCLVQVGPSSGGVVTSPDGTRRP